MCIWIRVGQSLIRSSLISALFKRATKRAITLSLFQKERQKERSLFQKEQRAERSLFQKEQRAERSLLCSFKKNESAKMSKKWAIFQIAHFSLKKKSDRSFSKWANAQPCSCRVGQSLIHSFAHRSFPLFSKERRSDCSFWHSLQKSDWAIVFFLLFSKKRPKER